MIEKCDLTDLDKYLLTDVKNDNYKLTLSQSRLQLGKHDDLDTEQNVGKCAGKLLKTRDMI